MVEYSKIPFHIQILKAANKYWNDIALTAASSGRVLKFSDLYTKSYRFATALKKFGAQKDDIICVILPNCLEYPIIFLGAALIGCPISGISPTATEFELKHYMTVTKSRFIVVLSKINGIMKDRKHNMTIIMLKGHDENCLNFDDIISNTEPDYEVNEKLQISLNDTLIRPFSSGTSGLPKCVELTHRNYNCATAILRNAVFDQLSAEGRRSTLAFLPFYHASGFWALCFCLLDGHHSVVLESFQPSLMLRCIEQYKIDTINVVPAVIAAMCRSKDQVESFDFSSVTTVLCGSAPLGKELSEQFLKLYPNIKNLIQGYGMTEVVVLSHLTPLSSSGSPEYMGSCGKLLPGFEAKIVDSNTKTEIQEFGVAGELYLKSDSVMKGYYNDEAATSEAIDHDGWLHTGDVVYRDQNDYYFVVDRIKDLIKVNGLQVSPSELESILLTFPGVVDAAVVGLPNDACGQAPAAVVQLSHSMESNTSIADIQRYVNDRIAPHKYLKGGIRIVEAIPKTSTNKIIRSRVLELFN